jgi:hypothetical protein
MFSLVILLEMYEMREDDQVWQKDLGVRKQHAVVSFI